MQNLIVMSDVANAGGFGINSNTNITFDDSAASGVPASGVISGTVTYKPTNASVGNPDSFPAPAPAPSVNTTLAAFSGSNPNGTWSLYIVDDTTGDVGSITGGWSLTITTEEAAVATTTALTAAPNPSLTGNNVTFTATVRDGTTPVTTGTVSFTEVHDHARRQRRAQRLPARRRSPPPRSPRAPT